MEVACASQPDAKTTMATAKPNGRWLALSGMREEEESADNETSRRGTDAEDGGMSRPQSQPRQPRFACLTIHKSLLMYLHADQSRDRGQDLPGTGRPQPPGDLRVAHVWRGCGEGS